jgi:xanthine dehydrogenase YagS FAD-binding subunit
MISFPRTPADVAAAKGEIRAGGTDLTHRRHRGLSNGGDIVDLRECAGLNLFGQRQEGFTIGARVRIAHIAADADIQRLYPGLAMAAGGLATPQVRAVATLGGGLLQAVRCAYFRAPELKCLRKGGATCLARQGTHINHVIFDLGPCAAPSVSTLAVSLLAYDALVLVHGRDAPLTIGELYGDPDDPTRIHVLGPGELLTGVVLPPPFADERAAYFRSSHRRWAEWPLVECTARFSLSGNTVADAVVAVGAVANSPIRLPLVEQALIGQPATAETLATASAKAIEGASPLPQTEWKVDVLRTTVLTTLEQALGLEQS